MTSDAVAVINGWTIFVHPLFMDQLQALILEFDKSRAKYPDEYLQKNAAKRLGAVLLLAFEKIPANPADPSYRQGDTLGGDYKHWFRAKFFQQYRLFFRYDTKVKVIIYGWVNDDSSRRAYGSKTDAYAIFRKMLKDGNPPNDWNELRQAIEVDDQGRAARGGGSTAQIINDILQAQTKRS